MSDCCCEKGCKLGLPDDNALETNLRRNRLGEMHPSAGTFAALQPLVSIGYWKWRDSEFRWRRRRHRHGTTRSTSLDAALMNVGLGQLALRA